MRGAQQKAETECLLRRGRKRNASGLPRCFGKEDVSRGPRWGCVEFSVTLFSETNLPSCWIRSKVEKRHVMHGHNGQGGDLLTAPLLLMLSVAVFCLLTQKVTYFSASSKKTWIWSLRGPFSFWERKGGSSSF